MLVRSPGAAVACRGCCGAEGRPLLREVHRPGLWPWRFLVARRCFLVQLVSAEFAIFPSELIETGSPR